jgi:hypothetical protein
MLSCAIDPKLALPARFLILCFLQPHDDPPAATLPLAECFFAHPAALGVRHM